MDAEGHSASWVLRMALGPVSVEGRSKGWRWLNRDGIGGPEPVYEGPGITGEGVDSRFYHPKLTRSGVMGSLWQHSKGGRPVRAR